MNVTQNGLEWGCMQWCGKSCGHGYEIRWEWCGERMCAA